MGEQGTTAGIEQKQTKGTKQAGPAPNVEKQENGHR
jgi:hypothetical protein